MLDRASHERGLPPDFTMGDWIVRPAVNRIYRGNTVMRLRPQLMDLLVCLAAHEGRTVSKEEILDAVWPGQCIVETGMARCVAELRRILGDAAGQESRYIETIAKRGYRLIAPVALIGGGGEAAAPTGEVEVRPAPAAEADAGDTPPARSRYAPACQLGFLVVVVAAAFVAWHLQPSDVLWRDPFVVSFENRTGDDLFDEALRVALLVQFEESSSLHVVPEERVRREMRSLNRPADTPLTREAALAVCRQIGAESVLAGTLTPLGRHFVIGLEIVGCRSGDVLARQQVEVEGKEGVLAGVGQAVASIRRRLAEGVSL